MFYQWLRTTNDTNGNPRRLYAIYEVDPGGLDCNVVAVFDEGYAGTPSEIRDAQPAMPELPTVTITPAEYRDWKRQAKEQGILDKLVLA